MQIRGVLETEAHLLGIHDIVSFELPRAVCNVLPFSAF